MNAVVGGRAPANTVRESPWFQWVNSPAFEPTVRNLGASALSVMKRIGFERTAHVECRKAEAVLDETPGSYKDIDQVMLAQTDLVESTHVLSAFVNMKG